MPSRLSDIEALVRTTPLIEPSAKFWSSAELISIINLGIKDLWRDIVDLKQEHFLTIDNTNVIMPQSSFTLQGVPNDVHKIYMIEPRDLTAAGQGRATIFTPLDYNHLTFQAARAQPSTDPANCTVYYCPMKAGGPVMTTEIRVAPTITSDLPLSFCYVPTLATLPSAGIVPIPGEADNALVAWTVAYARAKESETRAPDATWLAVYNTEKAHLLGSLGLRQYQENTYAEAIFAQYWDN